MIRSPFARERVPAKPLKVTVVPVDSVTAAVYVVPVVVLINTVSESLSFPMWRTVTARGVVPL
jgi:hypothetical protein